ncbi:hypothetical protein GLA29479_5089 [Lysobacter antibioticus]|uniref:Uncharacterized protein n=1 Tax=Lysobacter antibioticus TaxID=84531 RepID=A0A0S2FD06_LYSAN|nr:hypothetical protein [Lysobacter antibioticus]ALN65914.1 hypothetical protein GLA29479_5089 [Lysobacter antibioticus]ALN81382.1 hypothetical protein LA76x_3255 [Lysobacter antibioticus]
MGQAEAAPKTPRYDRYLRRACAEWVIKLRDRNYGYRIVRGGGIVDRGLGATDSVVVVSWFFNDAEELNGLSFDQLEVETNKRNL